MSERDSEVGPKGEGRRPAAWTRLAWLPLVACAAGAVYLGSRPGGPTPTLVYRLGPLFVALVAILGLGVALAGCALRRPFVQPGRVGALLALCSAVAVASAPFPYPTSHDGRFSRVRFCLPFEPEPDGSSGEWVVRWGGEHWSENVLVVLPHRCRGFDLERLESGAVLTPSGGDELGDWYGFGHDVLAPAAGRVTSVLDGQPDRLPDEPFTGENLAGNHVVLEVAAGEYLVLAGLQQGSIAVEPGETLETGDLVGRIGNSGASRFSPTPHLAIHLQDTPEPGLGEGIPMRFHDYRVAGRRVESGVPTGGIDRDGGRSGTRLVPQGRRDTSPTAGR